MVKENHQHTSLMNKFIFLGIALSFLFLWGCSGARYSINKIKRTSPPIAKENAISESRQDLISSDALMSSEEMPENNIEESNSLTASNENNIGIINLPVLELNKSPEVTNESPISKRSLSEKIIQRKIEKKVAKTAGLSGGKSLLWTIVVILLALWLLGLLFGSGSLGGLVHILLVVALVLIIYKLLT